MDSVTECTKAVDQAEAIVGTLIASECPGWARPHHALEAAAIAAGVTLVLTVAVLWRWLRFRRCPKCSRRQ